MDTDKLTELIPGYAGLYSDEVELIDLLLVAIGTVTQRNAHSLSLDLRNIDRAATTCMSAWVENQNVA